MTIIHVMPVQIGRAEAERRIVGHLPTARCLSSRLLHHPYAGLMYRVEQAAFGKRMLGRVHTMVDLCNGSAAICNDAWPDLHTMPAERQLDGPDAVLDEAEAEHRARQCVIRAMLHRRLSLRHPDVALTERIMPLYKPNWLLRLQIDGTAQTFDMLVDGLSGIHHTVSVPHAPADSTP